MTILLTWRISWKSPIKLVWDLGKNRIGPWTQILKPLESEKNHSATLSSIISPFPSPMETAIATVSQATFGVNTRSLSSNFTAGSVSALGFSSPANKSPIFTQRGRLSTARASVAVEEKTETKAAVIRIGTRGRWSSFLLLLLHFSFWVWFNNYCYLGSLITYFQVLELLMGLLNHNWMCIFQLNYDAFHLFDFFVVAITPSIS